MRRSYASQYRYILHSKAQPIVCVCERCVYTPDRIIILHGEQRRTALWPFCGLCLAQIVGCESVWVDSESAKEGRFQANLEAFVFWKLEIRARRWIVPCEPIYSRQSCLCFSFLVKKTPSSLRGICIQEHLLGSQTQKRCFGLKRRWNCCESNVRFQHSECEVMYPVVSSRRHLEGQLWLQIVSSVCPPGANFTVYAFIHSSAAHCRAGTAELCDLWNNLIMKTRSTEKKARQGTSSGATFVLNRFYSCHLNGVALLHFWLPWLVPQASLWTENSRSI